MANFETTQVNHTKSFDVVDGASGVQIATREIFDNIAFENINKFEGLMLRNTFIASNDYMGGMIEGVSASTVTQNNPAGSFRSLLTPKGQTNDFGGAITSLGDIKFDTFGTDTITLEINDYRKSGNPKLIYEVDAKPGSWLVSDIQSAVSGQAISALVRYINYKVYRTLKEGAEAQFDNQLGLAGRVRKVSTKTDVFTNELIDDIAGLKALPYDRYVTGFDEDELVIALSPKGKAKLLKEKLVIYDGQFMGETGKFFTGLPYTHRFAGVATFETKFLNDNDGTNEYEYIGMPVGKWGPLAFHLAKFSGRAEVAPFTDGAIGIYGTVLSGMKVEKNLDQYIFAGTTATIAAPTNNLKDIKVTSDTAGEIKISVGLTGAAKYRISKATDVASGAFVDLADGEQIVKSLTADTLYRVEFSLGTDDKAITVVDVITK